MKYLFYYSIALLLGFGCSPKSEIKQPQSSIEKPLPDEQNPCFKLNCESSDSANYTHIKNSFYQGKDGELYEKQYSPSMGDSCCGSRAFYENRFEHSSVSERKHLKDVIDVETYAQLAPCQYDKDKKHVYWYVDNSDGGFRRIVEGADAPTFECIDSAFWWGVDKQHVFYRGSLVEGLNSKHLKILHAVPSYPMEAEEMRVKRGKPTYVKNDKVVFYEDEQVVRAHVPSFRVVDSSKYDAIDKYRNYMRGKPVGKR
jgi:hypothetical protein